MKMVTDNGPKINWQAKYLEQINTRLAGLEHGQHRLEEKVDTRFDKADARMDRLEATTEAGFRELRRMIWGTLGILGTAVIGVLVQSAL